MENLFSMSGARAIPSAAFHESKGAAGILPAEHAILPAGYVFSVAAGFQPDVEPGILPGGLSRGLRRYFGVQSCHSGRQDAALYGSQDGCRYSRKLAGRLQHFCRRACPRRRFIPMCMIAGLLSLGLTAAHSEETNKVHPARLKISGFDLLGNRELTKTIRLMSGKKAPPDFYDANFVEDAALIIMSTLNREGYLAPHISAVLTLSDGQEQGFEWDKNIDTVLPGPLEVKKARFHVRRGVRYYYQHLSIQGLQSLSQSDARRLFVETGFLVSLKSTRIYTPSRLDRSILDLSETLGRKGFEHPSVKVVHLERNDATGAIRVDLAVEEGLRTLVRSVTTEEYGIGDPSPRAGGIVESKTPYSRLWLQNFVQGLRTNQYRNGFPDASVEVSTVRRETNGPNVFVDLHAQVRTGPKIKLGEVKFEGNQRTHQSVLESRIELKPSKDLDRIEVEHGRNRLARLGAFDSVSVRYEPVDDETRDVVYEVKESKALDFSLLFGYGRLKSSALLSFTS